MTLQAELAPLARADGSASFTCNGYSVLAAVNGPIEVQRRDEIPEEVTLEVTVRPAAGVGGVRERHFESIIHKTLRHIIQVTVHPRTLIQLVLQVTATPPSDTTSAKLPQAASDLSLLPALLNAASLALLSASLPLTMTLTSTVIAVTGDKILEDPSSEQLEAASSTHVLAFSSEGELLMVESEGPFGIDTWEAMVQVACRRCHGDTGDEGTKEIDIESEPPREIESFVKNVVREKVSADERWRQDIK